jgi:cysteine desulfurase
MKPIYLDYNATTPIDPEVAKAMRPYLEEYFGNPSSSHSYGSTTKMAIEKARKQVAELIGCEASEIIFTSGGTESNNYAIKGAARANKHRGNHIITSQVEHPAVFEVCKYLEKNGFTVTYLPVDQYGSIALSDLEKAITPQTILITIMHANNEVGTILPVEKIGEMAAKHNILFHSDAAQSVGKIPVNVHKMGVQLLSIAGHKLYAPKGIGALYIKNGVRLEKLMHGADHEQNLRAGTENVLEIVGLGEAAAICQNNLPQNQEHYAAMRNYLWKRLLKLIPQLQRNGHPDNALPNTLSVSFHKVEANTLTARLDNIAVSAGAACHAESIDVSAVLSAMKIPLDYAMGTLRFSTGRTTTKEEIDAAVEEVVQKALPLMSTSIEQKYTPATADNIKLTHYTHGLGCACKIEPQKLDNVLKKLAPVTNANVLVGTDTSDDAAVYLINKEQALVQTLDFFTPIVDNAFDFGSIAAANALSDVYAMGAKPLFALNIVGFPDDTLPMEVLEQMLLGAQAKAQEAGIPILGGHTIEDPEPKYGMVVSGLVHPEKIWKNQGAQPGDALVLTKPLGTGIISTGMKRGLIDEQAIKALTQQMSELNKYAAEALEGFNVHACTDVTGFGLLGHLYEMLNPTNSAARLYFDHVPFIDTAVTLAAGGVIPGGTHRNLNYVQSHIQFGKRSKTQQLLLADAQTSGGLLIAMDKNEAEQYCKNFVSPGVSQGVIIGEIIEKNNETVIEIA